MYLGQVPVCSQCLFSLSVDHNIFYFLAITKYSGCISISQTQWKGDFCNLNLGLNSNASWVDLTFCRYEQFSCRDLKAWKHVFKMMGFLPSISIENWKFGRALGGGDFSVFSFRVTEVLFKISLKISANFPPAPQFQKFSSFAFLAS